MPTPQPETSKLDVYVAVISSGRPGNVPHMEALIAKGGRLPPPVWYVGKDEAPDYKYCGATFVEEGGPLCASRNLALADAWTLNIPCLQLSDDLRRIGWANGKTSAKVEPITLDRAVSEMLNAMTVHGGQLAGGAPTPNPFFSRPGVSRAAFVVGDMTLTAAGCEIRYDETLRLKEDYDYTLQHLYAFGRVARVDQLLATFLHRTNKGGAVAVRSPELEDETIAYLMGKWPAHLRLNRRRKHEILLRWAG